MTKIFTVVLGVLILASSLAYGQGYGRGQCWRGNQNGQGHGQGRGYGRGPWWMQDDEIQRRGPNFVDENKNGICDRWEAAQNK